MTLESLEKLRKEGTLNDLYQSGMISPKVFVMLEAGLKVNSLISMKVKKAQAVRVVAKHLRVTPKCVYTYLSHFQEKKIEAGLKNKKSWPA